MGKKVVFKCEDCKKEKKDSLFMNNWLEVPVVGGRAELYCPKCRNRHELNDLNDKLKQGKML
jgi:hypothetical protein